MKRMMSVREIALAVVLGTVSSLAAGQQPTTSSGEPTDSGVQRQTPAPAVSGVIGMGDAVEQEDTSQTLPQVPELLGGQGTTMTLPSEVIANYLRAGINVEAAYDDNALLSEHDQVGSTIFSVFPNVAIGQSRSRLRWDLGYAGGLSVVERLSSRNQGSHSLDFSIEGRVSPHVTLRAEEDFQLRSGVFAGNQDLGGGGNGLLITPLASQRLNRTTVEGNYHFALNDVAGASGSFYDQHYGEVAGQSELIDTRGETGSVFWLHRVFGRNWAGPSYRYQHLTYDPGAGISRTHSVLLVDTMTLSNRITLSGYIGPQRASNEAAASGGGTVSSSGWSVMGGVDGGWQNQRTSVSAGYSRSVADGGGVIGAVRTHTIHGEARRQIVGTWAISGGVTHGANSAVIGSSLGVNSADNTSVHVSVDRNVGKNLGFRIGYAHEFQKQVNSGSESNADRNRVFVSLSYQWARPLGN